MSQFVKSILNYYAAFTETRFSNKSTLNYKWFGDPNLTLDITFFTDFFRLWLTKLENNDLGPVEVRPGQFKREIPAARFRQKLDYLLLNSFTREHLQKFLADEQNEKDLTNPDELRKAFLEGTRAYNLALRQGIEQVIHVLQGEEIVVSPDFQDEFRQLLG